MTGRSQEAQPGRARARTCTECGTQAGPDQSFCDGCGAVLGWAAPHEPEAASARAAGAVPTSAEAAFPPGSSGAAPLYAPMSGGGSAAVAPTPGNSPHEQPSANRTNGTVGHGGTALAAGPANSPDAAAFSGGADGGAVGYDPMGPASGAVEAGGMPLPPLAGTAQDGTAAGTPAGAAPGDTAVGTPSVGGPTQAATTAGAVTGVPAVPASTVPAPRSPEPVEHAGSPEHAFGGPADDTLPQPAASPTGYGSAEDRARALLVPVADPQGHVPAPSTVAPVMPGRPVAARPIVRAPGGVPDEDGPAACPFCGTGNRTDRHFCRRCAMPMAGRPHDETARRPWWRRLLDFRRRPTPFAGDRPRLRRGLGRLPTWIAGLVAAVLLIIAGLHVGSWTDAVKDHFAKRAPVVPDSVAASKSFKGHGPQMAFDEFNNTWWGPGISQAGDGQWLEARFDDPVHLLNLIITPGESTRPTDLGKSAEPHRIDVQVTTSDGHVTTHSLILDQGSGGQTVKFNARRVSSVRFTIRSSYGVATTKQVAIAEIEFFGPKQSG